MYALIGSNNAKISNNVERIIPESEFWQDKSFDDCTLIIDNPDFLEFAVDKLTNGSLIDAYDYLSCRKKSHFEKEDVFWIRKKFPWKFWEKTNYFFQKVTVTDEKLLSNIKKKNGAVPIEFLTALFCDQVCKSDESSWWIYIAEHKLSGIRIIAGYGRCVILSRSIPAKSSDNEEISKELLNSVRFLRRFGLEDNLKIITTLKNLKAGDQEIEQTDLSELCVRFNVSKTEIVEEFLISSADHKGFPPAIFSEKSKLIYVFNKFLNQIMAAITAISLFFCFYIFWLYFDTEKIKEDIIKLSEKDKIIFSDAGNNVQLSLSENNFFALRNFIDVLKNSRNPVSILQDISEFIDDNETEAENIVIKNDGLIEIKTKSDKVSEEKIKKNLKEGWTIDFKSTDKTSGEDFEEIKNNDDKHEVTLCIQIK